MITYSLTKTGTGTSSNLISSNIVSSGLPSPFETSDETTIQVIGTSAATGKLEITLNGTDFTEIFDFTFASADNDTFVFPGNFSDIRLNLSANSGTVKLIAGI